MSTVLKNWSFKYRSAHPGTHYRSPTQKTTRICLSGEVYGHKNLPNGKLITTNYVIRARGRTFQTKTGSIYKLSGAPDPFFIDWLEDQGYGEMNWDRPMGNFKLL